MIKSLDSVAARREFWLLLVKKSIYGSERKFAAYSSYIFQTES